MREIRSPRCCTHSYIPFVKKAVVYKFDGANWNQYGSNTLEPNSLKTDNIGKGFATDVSINADGNIIIIGDNDYLSAT